MGRWRSWAGGGAAAAVVLAGWAGAARAQDQASPGRQVYDEVCAACHAAPEAGSRTPPVASLRRMSAEQIRAALRTGVMKGVGDGLSPAQLNAVVGYLAAPEGPASTAWLEGAMCAADKRAVDLGARPAQLGFGVDADNSRHMSAAQAGFTGKQAANLEVAWTFALPKTNGLRGQGVVVGSTLF